MIDLLWTKMLDADMNVRYYRHLRDTYSWWDSRLKIFIAVTSSAGVASWQIWGQTKGFMDYSLLWELVSGTSAFAAVVLPVLGFGGRIGSAANIRKKYEAILNNYEVLWSQRSTIKEDNLKREIKRLNKLEEGIEQGEINLPHKNKLVIKCQDEVLEARGIS